MERCNSGPEKNFQLENQIMFFHWMIIEYLTLRQPQIRRAANLLHLHAYESKSSSVPAALESIIPDPDKEL